MSKKFLDASGIQHLWKQLSLQDYPNNETLTAVITGELIGLEVQA